MNKAAVLLLIILFTGSLAFSQKGNNSDKVHYYKTDDIVSSSKFEMIFSESKSESDYCQFLVEITNKTKDYLQVDLSNFKFTFRFGTYKPSKEIIFISPKQTKKITIKVEGSSKYLVKKFMVNIRGLAIVPSKGKSSALKSFQVLNISSVSTDLLKISLKNKSIFKDIIVLDFESFYSGKKISLIDESRITMKIDGLDKEFVNSYETLGIKLINNGESINLKVIAKISETIKDTTDLNIVVNWNKTFTQVEAKKLDAKVIIFQIDEKLTTTKNGEL